MEKHTEKNIEKIREKENEITGIVGNYNLSRFHHY